MSPSSVRRIGLILLAVLVLGTGAAVAAAVADSGSDGGPSAFLPAPDDSAVEVGPAACAPDAEWRRRASAVVVAVTSSSSSSSSTSSTSTTSTTIDPLSVAHAFPVDPAVGSSFTPQAHANYRATDIFATTGCGTALLAPVTGTVDEVVENTWDPAVGDPATRGGNTVAIVGDDGVRYYLAHFQAIDPSITPGARVVAGDYLGEMGDTGRVECLQHALRPVAAVRERRMVGAPRRHLARRVPHVLAGGGQPLAARRAGGVVRRVPRRLQRRREHALPRRLTPVPAPGLAAAVVDLVVVRLGFRDRGRPEAGMRPGTPSWG